jgi:hypothetical protein
VPYEERSHNCGLKVRGSKRDKMMINKKGGKSGWMGVVIKNPNLSDE